MTKFDEISVVRQAREEKHWTTAKGSSDPGVEVKDILCRQTGDSDISYNLDSYRRRAEYINRILNRHAEWRRFYKCLSDPLQ